MKVSQRKYSLVKKNLAACIVDGIHYHQNLDWIDEMKHLPGSWIWKAFRYCYYFFGGDLRSDVKTVSIRKLSKFNFQWIKTSYQENFKSYRFLFYTFQGLRKVSYGSPGIYNFKFHRNWQLKQRRNRHFILWNIWSFCSLFYWASIRTFSPQWSYFIYNLLHL